MSHFKKYATAFAKAYNHLDTLFVENLLSDDFCYTSQWVFNELKDRKAYLDYLKPKFETVLNSNTKVAARLAKYNKKYCIVIYQVDMSKQKPTKISTLLIDVVNEKVKRADMCMIPSTLDLEILDIFPS